MRPPKLTARAGFARVGRSFLIKGRSRLKAALPLAHAGRPRKSILHKQQLMKIWWLSDDHMTTI
jgi:hypothetical protein